jgi:transposase InsO family protein
MFQEVFSEYGLPDSILSDNEARFADFRKGYTKFERWLMELDIPPTHGRIKLPPSQGKIERFHQTMKQELLNHASISDIVDAQVQLENWRVKYNTIRSHEALGMKTPGQVYIASSLAYPEKIQECKYGGQYHVIKVNSWGYDIAVRIRYNI